MATILPTQFAGAVRRVVLIDFDWRDADRVPELLSRPGIVVGMVAGEKPDDVGVRVAELCGLRQSVDLADLTREFFDLAIVGEASPRRAQVVRLLQALGTPVAFPSDLSNPNTIDRLTRGAAAPEPPADTDPGVVSSLLDLAIPDLGPDVEPIVEATPGPRSWPEPDDRPGLEQALARCREATSAATVEVHFGAPGHIERWAMVGPEDPLLRTLARLALDLETPQVVAPVGNGPPRIWGAWPFRAEGRRGVVAASGIAGDGARADWERWTRELRDQWTREAQRRVAATTAASRGWLEIDDFREQVERALDRHRDHHAPCAVHRLRFQGAAAAVEKLCGALPPQLRAGDCICRPGPNDVLLLWSGARHDFSHLRRRLIRIWEQAWRDAGESSAAPPITDERIELEGPEDAGAFRDTASRWAAP
jgi:hypothetical protein